MQTSQVKNRQLTPLELAAWRGFLRVHAALVRELDRELEMEHGLPLSHYEVLLYLHNAPGHRMRMSELASSVLLSQSGITRLVDRLERDGLVVREACPEDRRGLNARITEAGQRRLADARPTHRAGVHARFLSHFDEDELRALGEAWERLKPGVND
jgi:DNA-binding MarR family transcriptional regulator